MIVELAVIAMLAPKTEGAGLEVMRVLPGGQGEARRLRKGDIVLSYNEVALSTFKDLRQAMADAESAKLEEVILRVRRRDKVYRVKVKVGKIGLELAEVETKVKS